MTPQNIELEKTVLGKLLNLEKFETQVKYIDLMNEDFFSTYQTKEVYRSMRSCVDQNTLASPMHLIEKNFVDNDSLVDILTYKFESNQKMIYKINDLKLLAYRREAIKKAESFIKDLSKGEDVISKSEKFLLETTNALSYGKRRKRKNASHMIKNSLKNITTGASHQNLVSYHTDFLDSRYFHERGQTHVIGAQPGVGKTAIGLTIAKNAILAGKRVVFFVKESSKEELFERIIAQESGISYNRFKFNYQGLNRNEQISIESNYKKFADYWRNIHFYGCDDYDHSLSQMDEILDDINQEHGQIDIVVEDYVQNMRAPRWMRNAPRHEVISYNMEGLSAMHKRHKVAGIVLAQLNREVNSRPTITNLKGSSMLEQEAHIITFLHRERNTKLNNGMLPTDIYCEKQRLGPEFAPIKIGLKIPNVEFIQGRFNEDDHPKDLEMPPA